MRQVTKASGSRRMPLYLFLLVLGIYGSFAGGHTYSSDEEALYATTKALAETQSFSYELNEGNGFVLGGPSKPGPKGGSVAVTGLGQSVAGVPFFVVGSFVGRFVHADYIDFVQRLFTGWTNTVVTAIQVVLMFLIALRLGVRQGHALLFAVVFGLGTFAFPHAKTYFSEPLATTLILGAVYLAIRGVRGDETTAFVGAGALCGLALVARSTTFIFPPIVGLYVLAATWARHRSWAAIRSSIAFALGGFAALGMYFFANYLRYGSAIDFGVGAGNVVIDAVKASIVSGLAGLLLSPGKSLFLYAPIVLVGIASIPRAVKRFPHETILFLALGVANLLFFARIIFWHGDHSWGPRYLIMSLPFLALPAIANLSRKAWRMSFMVLGGIGFISAMLGAALYFNQYFSVVDDALGEADNREDWLALMHHRPYWSPIAGHARALPEAIANSVDGVDGEIAGFPSYPATTTDRFIWYFRPPQLDLWAYWTMRARGPRKVLVALPIFWAASLVGALGIYRSRALLSDAGPNSPPLEQPG